MTTESESASDSEAEIGPWFFAWTDAGETSFGSQFEREDEQIFSITISQDEGDFAAADIVIINPRIGLLNPGRKVWAWISYRPAGTAGDATPLFYGRLIGIPEDIDGETVKLSFIARPDDYIDQQEVIAADFMADGAPFWDAVWFDPGSITSDDVLESRPELWNVDPTTLVVTTSNIIDGEDGTLEVGEDEIFYDSVHVTYGDAAVRQVSMTATVTWTQNAAGNLPNLVPDSMASYTGAGLVNNWPQPGNEIGGGWTVGATSGAVRVNGSDTPELGYYAFDVWGGTGQGGDTFGSHRSGDLYCFIISPKYAAQQMNDWQLIPIPPVPTANTLNTLMQIPQWIMATNFQPAYSASRSRTEVLTFVLGADVQSILTEPDGSAGGSADTVSLSMSSSEIASPIDPGGALPIGDVRSPAYFSTDRGDQSIQYLIAVARATLIARARTVFVEFTVDGDYGVSLLPTCRKNVLLTDHRLPGGSAAGKITAYTFSMDGDAGSFTLDMTIGCSIGQGGTVAPSAGTPDYVNEGYVDVGYQAYTAQFIMPIPGEIVYESQNGLPPNDDGVDFFRMTPGRCVQSETIKGGLGAQIEAMNKAFKLTATDGATGFLDQLSAPDTNSVFATLNSAEDQIDIRMVPIGPGPYETDYDVAVSQLKIPKTIDLQADSVS